MSEWLDFAAIKSAVGLAPLLRRYGVQLRRSGRDQYRGRCPIHRGEGREAFHANLTRNLFHCFSCGAGGTVLDFVAAMERCTLREAALKLQREMAAPGALLRPATCHAKQRVTEKRRVPQPLGFMLRGVDNAHPYLAARGIDQRTARQFGVGFYRGPGFLSGRLVFPIHNAQEELVAYCGRALDGCEPRYRFPPGFTKSEILFNLHRAAAANEPAVVVVEGFFDCLKVYQAGFSSVVALMGAALYEPQQRALLERFRRVVLMLDGDAAGQHATRDIAARLRPLCSVVVLPLEAQAQPDQLSSEAIRFLLQPAFGQAA